jgi:hypothetical protein
MPFRATMNTTDGGLLVFPETASDVGEHVIRRTSPGQARGGTRSLYQPQGGTVTATPR